MATVLLAVLCLVLPSAVGVVSANTRLARPLVYGGSAVCSLAILLAGLDAMGAPAQQLALPLGLPQTGSHLRLDSLSAFFLVIAGLGGAGASLFAIGYGRHEEEPARVMPFHPLFLAGMTLVLLADDAFAFLFAWELMSLASWALVMAHHRDKANAQAAFVYLVMATLSGLTLLLAFGLLAGPTRGVSGGAPPAAGAGRRGGRGGAAPVA